MDGFERKFIYPIINSFTFIPRVSKQCIFNIDRQQDRSTEVSKTGKYKAPIN